MRLFYFSTTHSQRGNNPIFFIETLTDGVDLPTLSAVMQKGNFSYNDVDSMHYGFTDKLVWYRYTEATATPLLLMLGNFTLHYVDFYFVKEGKLLSKRSMGQARPFAGRYRVFIAATR
ncbi:MAG TPA: 7TM-DISM domain-containing protein [Turneriella sp.]|nr:7TM-DISM domain-containing protein [Turneriella sp.]